MQIATKTIENSILYIVIILALIGLLVLGNITSFRFNNQDFVKQLMWILISISIFLIVFFVNLDKIRNLSFFLLFFGVLLLAAVWMPGIGVSVNDSNRWIDLGPIIFQSSTLARIILILYLAHFLEKNKDMIRESGPIQFVKNFIVIIIFPAIYMGLILIEPDLSTAAILFMIWLSILFVARIKISTVFFIAILAILLAFCVLQIGPEYRRARYETYYKYNVSKSLTEDEEDDILQPREALIALSHGKLFGKGSEQSRAKLFYLPFPKTDYIFAIFGEEFGFIGSFILIILYVVLIFGGLTLAQRAGSFFYALLIAGLTFNLAYNIIINIGVVTYLIPSTGVSLPFISYGGSALLMDSISIAVIINASRNSNQRTWK